jgi:hypothetical protein
MDYLAVVPGKKPAREGDHALAVLNASAPEEGDCGEAMPSRPASLIFLSTLTLALKVSWCLSTR